jgi:hypothetical protein
LGWECNSNWRRRSECFNVPREVGQLLQEVWDMLELDPTKLVRKRLEQIRGFLQYVIQTYSGFASYLTGFHMTIDGFWRGRDENGWRMAEALWKEEKKYDEDWDRSVVED